MCLTQYNVIWQEPSVVAWKNDATKNAKKGKRQQEKEPFPMMSKVENGS